MVLIIKDKYMYRLFLLFCFISCISSCYNSKGLSHNISQDFVRDTIYTTFEKYDRTVVRYENTIVNHIKQKVVIIAKDRNNICKSEILFVGSILNSDNDTISFLKKEDTFGLKESPHSSGNIIVYKNRIRQGYYSNFSKGFFVKVEDNILHIKDVMEEDLNGQPVLGILNLINFKEEIPHSVFIYINQDDGDEYVFHKYNDK